METYKLFKLDEGGETYKTAAHYGSVRQGFYKAFAHDRAVFNDELAKQRLIENIASIDPNIHETLGLNAPVIQVQDNQIQSHPRAYEQFPTIYENSYGIAQEDGSTKDVVEMYMFSPIGYDGQYYEPQDATLLSDEKDIKRVEAMLFAGGWLTPAVISSQKQNGVEVPHDYEPIEDDAKLHASAHTRICFIAQGQTLVMLEDYDERVAEQRAATDLVMSRIDEIVKQDLREGFMAQIPQGEDYYINSMISQSDDVPPKNVYEISVRQSGNVGMMAAGQPLTMQDNDFFHVKNGHGRGEYVISPNTKTQQGRALKALMDDVPQKPHLSDYPSLVADLPFEEGGFDAMLGVNGHVPMMREFQGHKVLTYNTDDPQYDEFCPPDSIPFSAELYNWLQADAADQQMGISAPPAPDELVREIEMLEYRLGHDGNAPGLLPENDM